MRDFILNGEDVDQLASVGLRPEVRIGIDVDQLRGNPDAIASFAHRALQYVGYAQFAADVTNLQRAALEGEGRCA
jgi:hypothetical protein